MKPLWFGEELVSGSHILKMMAVVGLKMCGSPSISGGDEFKYEVLERGSTTERFDFEFICMALDLTQQRSCVNSGGCR